MQKELLAAKGNGVDRPSYQRLLKFGMVINYTCQWILTSICETLAQSVEHTPFKRRVEGSNPSCLTNYLDVAQLGEHYNSL